MTRRLKRATCVLALATSFLISGCAITYNVPAIKTSINTSAVQKVPLAVAVNVPKRDNILSETEGGATVLLPDGELLNELSEDLFPRVFKKAKVGTFETPPKDVDAVVTLGLKDVNITPVSVGLGFGLRFLADIVLDCTVKDLAGAPIWEYSVKGANEGRAYVSPVIPRERLMGETFSAALADAYERLGRRMSDSSELREFAEARNPGASPVLPAGAAPVPNPTRPIDGEKGRALLKTAFESGFLTAAQLTRALDELNSAAPSRILGAFVAGELDSKQFGSIY